ncbi:hypothetical protein, partial [Amycolatopsis bartoniae]
AGFGPAPGGEFGWEAAGEAGSARAGGVPASGESGWDGGKAGSGHIGAVLAPRGEFGRRAAEKAGGVGGFDWVAAEGAVSGGEPSAPVAVFERVRKLHASLAAAAPHGQFLPVRPELRDLLPAGGLRRGSTVAVHGSAALVLALLAEATATGSWAAAVGLPDIGLAAAEELGVEVGRLALVPRPGVEFASVTAALLDGVDLVAVTPGAAPSVARRLSARARHRGAVLLSCGPWPGAELDLTCVASRWEGLDGGAGHFRTRRLEVRISGRGAATRPRHAELALPGVPQAAEDARPATWIAEDVG